MSTINYVFFRDMWTFFSSEGMWSQKKNRKLSSFFFVRGMQKKIFKKSRQILTINYVFFKWTCEKINSSFLFLFFLIFFSKNCLPFFFPRSNFFGENSRNIFFEHCFTSKTYFCDLCTWFTFVLQNENNPQTSEKLSINLHFKTYHKNMTNTLTHTQTH